MSSPKRVALVGLGNVGSRFLSLLNEQMSILTKQLKCPVFVTKIAVLNPDKPRSVELQGIELTTDAKALAIDPDIDILIETTGTLEPAYECVALALKHNKAVITSNKALLAERGDALFALSARFRTPIAYEASVCGGLPISKVLKDALLPDTVDSIAGIFNATSHYVLAQMQEWNIPFEQALVRAQEEGYAENDPQMDLTGQDAAYKLMVLAYVAFGASLSYSQVFVEGLEVLDAIDLQLAEQLGYKIKPIAIANRNGHTLECRVHPALIPKSHLLARVEGSNTAVWVSGMLFGEILLTGTNVSTTSAASAILSDLVSTIKAPQCHISDRQVDSVEVLPLSQFSCPYYLRFSVNDEPGMLAKISALFTNNGVSIEAMMQRPITGGENVGKVHLAFVTHVTKEYQIRDILETLRAIEGVSRQVILLRCFVSQS